MTGGSNITSSRASDDKMYPSASINAAAAVAVAAAARHPVSGFIPFSCLSTFFFLFFFPSSPLTYTLDRNDWHDHRDKNKTVKDLKYRDISYRAHESIVWIFVFSRAELCDSIRRYRHNEFDVHV